MSTAPGSWEEAVRWYRRQSGNGAAIRANYFDLPVRDAIIRYGRSEEFAEVSRLLGHGSSRRVLDYGAGNGIASFALVDKGWDVTSLEPDPSDEVGHGAIAAEAAARGISLDVVTKAELPLPLGDETFDAIHARQVLHHVPSLEATAREFFRVLKPGGRLLVTREHVADTEADRQVFLREHPLHAKYGGENAYPVDRYISAMTGAGFSLVRCWSPVESIINFYPGTEQQRVRILNRIIGKQLLGAGFILRFSPRLRRWLLDRAVRADRGPGRLFSFQFEKR